MMEEDKDELLDRYMAGEPITDEQKKQVEQWLHADPVLRGKARLLLQVYDWGRQKRQAVWTGPSPVVTLNPVARPFAWAAAASVALIAGFGLWWYNQTDTRVANSEPMAQKVAVYEKREGQLGFAKGGLPADSTLLIPDQSHIVSQPEYRFATYDTLQIRIPASGTSQHWHLVRLNEVDFQLVGDSITYPLELGRQLWLPLKRGH